MATIKGVAALQEWARRVTLNYGPTIAITNMSSCWKNGLAFCAIIHHYRPDLIDFSQLSAENIYENNLLAFTVAELLGVPPLLEAQDMSVLPQPDPLCVITYVAQLYNHFKDKKPFTSEEPNAETHPTVIGVEQTVPKKYDYSTLPRRGAAKVLAGIASADATNTAQNVATECAICHERVYLMERVVVDDCIIHRSCFKCAKCNKQLKIGLCSVAPTPDECGDGLGATTVLSSNDVSPLRQYECFEHERERLISSVSKKQRVCDKPDGKVVDSASENVALPPEQVALPPEHVALTVEDSSQSIISSNDGTSVLSSTSSIPVEAAQLLSQPKNDEVDQNAEEQPEEPVTLPEQANAKADASTIKPRPDDTANNSKLKNEDLSANNTAPNQMPEDPSEAIPNVVSDVVMDPDPATSHPSALCESPVVKGTSDNVGAIQGASYNEASCGATKGASPNGEIIDGLPNHENLEVIEPAPAACPEAVNITPQAGETLAPIPMPRKRRSGNVTPVQGAQSMEKLPGSSRDSTLEKPQRPPLPCRPPPPAIAKKPLLLAKMPTPVPAPRGSKDLGVTKPRTDYPNEKNPFDDDDDQENGGVSGNDTGTKAETTNPFEDSANDSDDSSSSSLSSDNPFKEDDDSVEATNDKDEKLNRSLPPRSEDNHLNPSNRYSLQLHNSKGFNHGVKTYGVHKKRHAPVPPPVEGNKEPKPVVKKRPAPPRPLPPRRNIDIGECLTSDKILEEFDILDHKQIQFEERSRVIEEKLRTTAIDAEVQESDILAIWFELIAEKNQLIRREVELVYMKRECELNELHSEIEFQLRCLVEKPKAERTEEDKEKEENLINRLLEVVNEKSQLIESREDELYRQKIEEYGAALVERKRKSKLREKLKKLKSPLIKSETPEEKKARKLHSKEKKEKAKAQKKAAKLTTISFKTLSLNEKKAEAST